MNANHTIPELDRKGLRNFGLTTGAVVVVLFGGFFPWLLDAKFPLWPWIIFAVLAVMGLAVPDLLRPVYKGWMRIGLLLNRIMTPLIMGIIFFGVVLPMGIIMRTFGKDPMARDLDKSSQSYRVISDKPTPESLERPF